MVDIKENIEILNRKIKTGKNENIKIVAATKYADVEQIKKAISSGINCIGENRVQEAEKKFKFLDIEKHMIESL